MPLQWSRLQGGKLGFPNLILKWKSLTPWWTDAVSSYVHPTWKWRTNQHQLCVIKNISARGIDPGRYGHVLPETDSNRDTFRGSLARCHKLLLSLWPMQEQVTESHRDQLCQSHRVVIIVAFGRDESQPRICFRWLHITLEISAAVFWIFLFPSDLISQSSLAFKGLSFCSCELHLLMFYILYVLSMHYFLMWVNLKLQLFPSVWNKWCLADVLPTFFVWEWEQCRLGTSILDLFNGWVLLKTRRTNWKVFSR